MCTVPSYICTVLHIDCIFSCFNIAAATIHRDSGDLCDLREELRSVRGDLVKVGRERDGALVRVRVVEGELVKRQKMIEDLLASGHITVSGGGKMERVRE